MIKIYKLLFLLIVVTCTNIISAQVSFYNFSQSSGSYTAITGGTLIAAQTVPSGTAAGALDDVNYTVALPFNFTFNGVVYNSGTLININSNGFINFGTAPATNNYTPISGAANNVISPMGFDSNGGWAATGTTTLGSPVITAISNTSGYVVGALVSGTNIPAGATIVSINPNVSITISANATASGSSITVHNATGEIRAEQVGSDFVIQFKNMRRYNTTFNQLNFQIILRQTTNVIEVVYGTIVNTATSYSPQVGLRGAVSTDYNSRTGTNWMASTASLVNTATMTLGTTGGTTIPSLGLTYTWTPPPADLMDYVNLQFPGTATIPFQGSVDVFTQGYEPGVTESGGPGAGIQVWIGISPAGAAENSNPNTWATWIPATFFTQVGNNDEFMAAIGSTLLIGTYRYASRWRLGTGLYSYGGFPATGAQNGFWDGVDDISGTLTITPPAAPGNDECAGALTAPVTTFGNSCNYTAVVTTGATMSTLTGQLNGCTGTGIDDDVWYTFTTTNAGTYTFSYTALIATFGTALSVGMNIYTGTCGALSEVALACSSGFGSGGTGSRTVAGLTAGTTYYLRLSVGSSPNSGTFNFCITAAPPVPSNDLSTGAIGLTVNADYACGTTTNGTTFGATQSPEPASTCSNTGTNDDVWYTFMASGPNHRISVSGTTSTIAISLYTGSPGSLMFLTGACASTTLNATGLSALTTYYVRVYTTSSTVGLGSNFTICVGTQPPPPANDNCSTATLASPLPYFFNQLDGVGATQTASIPIIGACGSMNDGAWYRVVGTGCVMTVAVTPNNWDPEVGVYTGSCGTFTCVGSADVGNLGGSEIVTFTSVLGTDYFINVGHFSSVNGDEGPFTINIGCTTANDECAGASSLTPVPGYFTNPGMQTLAGSTESTSVPSCMVASENTQDTWYTFTTDSDGIPNETVKIAVSATNATSDFTLVLYTGSCGALTEVACVDAFGDGGTETVQVTEAGFSTTYFLRVIDNFLESSTFNISASGSTALPVTILSFNAKAVNEKSVNLTWNVADEINVKEYIVERSNDNASWTAIGSVNATQKPAYAFNDNSPLKGINYYRLAIKDLNASVAFSQVRSVNFSGRAGLTLYPNPSNDRIFVSGSTDKNVVISVYNEVGQIVNTLSTSGETISGHGIDVSKLLPGAYSIQIKGEASVNTMRFIKQ